MVAAAATHPLNASGAVLMIGCIGAVLGLVAFCVWRLMRGGSGGGR